MSVLCCEESANGYIRLVRTPIFRDFKVDYGLNVCPKHEQSYSLKYMLQHFLSLYHDERKLKSFPGTLYDCICRYAEDYKSFKSSPLMKVIVKLSEEVLSQNRDTSSMFD